MIEKDIPRKITAFKHQSNKLINWKDRSHYGLSYTVFLVYYSIPNGTAFIGRRWVSPAHQVLDMNQVRFLEGRPANRTAQVGYAPFVYAGLVEIVSTCSGSDFFIFLELPQTNWAHLFLDFLEIGLFGGHHLFKVVDVELFLSQIHCVSSSSTLVHAVNEPSKTNQNDSTDQDENNSEDDVKSKYLNLLNHKLYLDRARVCEPDS